MSRCDRDCYRTDGRGAAPAAAVVLQARADADRPNIVVVVVDDLRWDDRVAEHPFVEMPLIDRIAREGVRFLYAFAMTSRAREPREPLNGLYPHSHGIVDNTDRTARAIRWRRLPGAPGRGIPYGVRRQMAHGQCRLVPARFTHGVAMRARAKRSTRSQRERTPIREPRLRHRSADGPRGLHHPEREGPFMLVRAQGTASRSHAARGRQSGAVRGSTRASSPAARAPETVTPGLTCRAATYAVTGPGKPALQRADPGRADPGPGTAARCYIRRD